MKGNGRSKATTFRCTECAYESARWMGFCPQCRASGALSEVAASQGRKHFAPVEVVSATGTSPNPDERSSVGIAEFDRVLGGGVVSGAAILVGGEPGVGKSTLLLQVADRFAAAGRSVIIVSAEESTEQVQMRARRIKVESEGVMIASARDVDDIIGLARERSPGMIVVDSIQTISSADVAGSAGGVSQVRESAARLIEFAKTSGTALVLVGHVTKDGSIAGPRTLEHMVDVVLYLEGELDRGLRFLRGIKNRFGSVNEVGVFDMTPAGLSEIADPSGLMISHRNDAASGTVLFPTLEGKRPLVVEIQALVVRTEAPQPRRAVNGLQVARVHQILGILERHLAIPLRSHEVYVSVMGGFKITEPAADLPLALAVASAYFGTPLGGTVAWGELGLTGDVRPVPGPAVRRGEAERVSLGPVISPEVGIGRIVEALSAAGLVEGLHVDEAMSD